MRIGSLFMMVAAVMMLGGCGGGMNASNSDAPQANEAHEKSWVTSHRNAIVSAEGATFTNISGHLLIDNALINENVTQCQVCHGADFLGSKGEGAGPACFECHVLDPIKYPVMCYSCHGGWPVVPTQTLYSSVSGIQTLRDNGWPVNEFQQWYSSARARRGGVPIDPAFVAATQSPSVHLKHAAIPTLPYDATFNNNELNTRNECLVCHGQSSDIGNIHHEVVMPALGLGCIGPLPGGCHDFRFIPGGGFVLSPPDCFASAICHVTLP